LDPQYLDLNQPLLFDKRLINRRQVWAANRFWMEMQNLKTKRYGNRGPHHWYQFLVMLKVFKFILRITGLYERGILNAEDILLKKMPLFFPNLPKAFDGFTILHLSDLHLDGMKNLEDRILNILGDQTVDLCVLTGDYRTELHGLHKHIIEKLKYLIERIHSKHGFVGILGNHDSCHMVNPMERIGINMLINSSHFIYQGDDRIQIIGTDDIHYYFSDQALHALEHAEDDFSIALIHSIELYDLAARMGVDLYLCGHTHAGQVCLPGGRPILTHVDRGRKFYHGHWTYLAMQGITHAGVGTSALPVRFNSRGEILLYTLHRKDTK
jgi:predicted MPP superfamily phosphohydrolase